MTAPRKVSRLSQSQVVGYRDRLESPICWTCSKAQGLNTPQRPGIPSRCISAGEAFELDCGTCGKPLLQVAIEFDEPPVPAKPAAEGRAFNPSGSAYFGCVVCDEAATGHRVNGEPVCFLHMDSTTAAPPAPSVTVFCDCGHTEAEHGKPGCLYECCTGFRPALDALRATAQPHPDAAGKGEHVHSYYPKGEHVPSYYPTCLCGATAEVIPEPPAPATASLRDKAIDAIIDYFATWDVEPAILAARAAVAARKEGK